MKLRTRPAAVLPRRRVAPLSSLLVLAAMGIVGDAHAQAGVAPTTLPVLRGVVSGSAVVNNPVAGAARPLMTVDQGSARAIIDWKSFNIGADAEVRFNHATGSSAATLNRIYDLAPSVIRGRLSSAGPTVNGQATPGGQVILINQNGILFDRGAQVNTQSLVASTLNLSNSAFEAGGLTGGGLTTPALAGGYDDTGATDLGRASGAIVLGNFGSGAATPARLTAGTGGSIILVAPTVDNREGLITAPDGQVILAAGSRAWLALNTDANDLTLRGLRVEIEADAAGQGLNVTSLVRNAGQISADRGNVTLAALAVNQEGRVSAQTAVQLNGSIYLRAQSRNAAQAGTVTLGAGSVTEVTPDTADTATLPDSQDYTRFRGVISVDAGTIDQQGTLRVPGGSITLDAANAADPTAARVYLAPGSETSVAGQWTDVDVAKNLATFRVTSNELKNAPDQKTGVLRGATVTVDLRQDSAILDLDGYRDTVPRSVSEKAGTGGSLAIQSTGSVIQREGAVLDASGGGYRYDGAMLATTRLMGADGRVYDLATAPQDRVYTSLLDSVTVTDGRWGQTETWLNVPGLVGRWQDASVQGLPGGSISVSSAAGLVLDGTLKGGVTVGRYQTANAPRGASLTIGQLGDNSNSTFDAAQRIGHVRWQREAVDTLGGGFGVDGVLTQQQIDGVQLAASQLFGAARQTADGTVEQGFGRVELNVNGRIELPADVTLAGGIGAAITFRAPQIDLAGDVLLPAGTLTLAPVPSSLIAPELGTTTERLVVRSGAELSVAGAWLNRSAPDGSFVGEPLPTGRQGATGTATTSAIAGGQITVSLAGEPTGSGVRFERGSVLDAGGGALLAGGRVTGGTGGSISITQGRDRTETGDWLQAELRGFATGQGAQLQLTMPGVRIDDSPNEGVLPGGVTRLGTELFSQQGFASFAVTASSGGVDLRPGTELVLQQRNLVIDVAQAATLPTGARMEAVAQAELLPANGRAAAALSLGSGQGSVTIGREAAIVADAGGSVGLSGQSGVRVEGRIVAPGGSIAVAQSGTPGTPVGDLVIAAGATLSTAGTFVATPNDRGLTQGTLYNGGTVTLNAGQSGLRIEPGSLIDVSAVSQTVDLATSGAQPGTETRTLTGHAGTVLLRAQGAAEIGGALKAEGGSGGGAGGSFALELRRPDGYSTLTTAPRIVVTPDSRTYSAADVETVDARVDAGALAAAGFEKLRLLSEDRIEFQGNGVLDFERGIRLDAPLLDFAGGSQVMLRSANVALGASLGPRERDGGTGLFTLNSQGVAPERETRRGDAVLTVDAGMLDLYGNFNVNGTALTRLQSEGDLRLIGRQVNTGGTGVAVVRQLGSLTTAGSVEIEAAQVYPATRTDYTIEVKDRVPQPGDDGRYLLVQSNGATPGDVYSAAGTLTLAAPTIVQGGVLKAPHGSIELQGSRLVELAPGSLTSVAGDGLTVPYGTTQSGTRWSYLDGSNVVLDAVGEGGKRIGLAGAVVDVQDGARVDLSGGGDVLATEFVPGNGGDSDITAAANTFAIIPKSRLDAAPYDLQVQAVRDIGSGFSMQSGRDAALYDSLRIGDGAGVPAGEYVLLPARYALLPDAYLVQLSTAAAFRNLQPGQTVALPNGSTLVAGFRSARGTGVQESLSVGVVVQPGAAVRRYSDYNLNTSAFFDALADTERRATPRGPQDAGRLTLAATGTLNLGGEFTTSPAVGGTGRLAEVDISGTRIAVVGQPGRTDADPAALQIAGAALSNLDASVLLGGTRQDDGAGTTRITTTATQVTIANDAASAVTLPELLVTARERIDVRAGSALQATGSAAAGGTLTAEADGALLRLSAGTQAALSRADGGTQGEVAIAEGALLSASKSMLVDGTRSVESAGTLQVAAGGSLALSSRLVSLGQTERAGGPLGGLVLSNAQLAGYAALDDLVLRAGERIDLIGQTQLGSTALARLTLDTPELRGVGTAEGAAAATLAAGTLTLRHSGTQVAGAATGSGTLRVESGRLLLAGGELALGGFSRIDLAATDEVLAGSAGGLSAAASTTITTPMLRADAGAAFTLRAADTVGAVPRFFSLDVAQPGAATAAQSDAAQPGLGGRLALEAGTLHVDAPVQARSGAITLTAHDGGAAALSLGARARLDAAGQAKDFNGRFAVADGGQVRLVAEQGGLAMAAGALIDVSAAAQGGAAGALQVQARQAALDGTLRANAAAPADGGRVQMDLGTLQDFTALSAQLGGAGFSGAVALRLREGDLTLPAGHALSAADVALTADTGAITVGGTIGGVAADEGGRIVLQAQDAVTLQAGARLLAGQPGVAGGQGGSVQLASREGAVVFERGATIDVRAGAGGAAGAVGFTVTRDAADRIAETRLEGQVLRHGAAGGQPATVDLIATRRYDVGATVADAEIAALAADHARFAQAVSEGSTGAGRLAALTDETGALQGGRVLGGTELVAAGDLTLTSPWNLTDGAWRAAGQPGTLTLRAAGTVTLQSWIGNPTNGTHRDAVNFFNELDFGEYLIHDNASDNILAGDTWSIRVAAGADLASADALAVRRPEEVPGSGHLLLPNADSRVSTGTGRIDLRAAGDIRLGDVGAAVFTSGRIGATDTAHAPSVPFIEGIPVAEYNRWGVAGGDVTLAAGGDILGAPGVQQLWVTEWLRRPREEGFVFEQAPVTDWWINRQRFQQAVGTLAGGDVDIRAGGSLRDLSAVAPTTGRTVVEADGTRRMDVQGGGSVRVQAAGDIDGGAVLLGRGQARVTAGGDIGAQRPFQVWAMGASSGDVPAGAQVQLAAGGSLTLAGVFNPTAMQLNAASFDSPAFGPSYGEATSQAVFFTYAADSGVQAAAKGGDLRYAVGAGLANARVLEGNSLVSFTSGVSTPSLGFTAFRGDIVGEGTGQLLTFPSADASVWLLAGGSLREVGLTVADRTPASIPYLPASAGAYLSQLRSLTSDDVVANAATGRIVQRENDEAFVVDLQALKGSAVWTGTAKRLDLPARARLYAGGDIVGGAFQFQNLAQGELSEMRADTGDIRPVGGIEIRGPGTLLVQAGRNVDLGNATVTSPPGLNIQPGGLAATGNLANPNIADDTSARITVLAGVRGAVARDRLDAAYAEIIALNGVSSTVLDLYAELASETDAALVTQATSVADLAARNAVYARFTALDRDGLSSRVLSAYRDALAGGVLPLVRGADSAAAAALYRLLNAEIDVGRLRSAGTVAALAAQPGGEAYAAYADLAARYPLLFTDYVNRRSRGALPTAVTPIVFSRALDDVVATVVPATSRTAGGRIDSFNTSIQTWGGSDIDLWAPGGDITVGLTTAPIANGPTVGVLTNAGGAVRSVLGGDFNINQGKVITALGGDILLYSAAGNIDAGRGAKTSQITASPQRTPVLDAEGNLIGYNFTVSAAATGSGIQTLAADPDGVGPLQAPEPGSVYLFAPAGTIDAGEAGIRSSGNIVINAQTVLNASNISAAGASAGVPQLQVGSLASALASAGASNSSSAAKAEDVARAADEAARRAAETAAAPKPTILSVEVLGFGDRNCREDDKNCFAK